MGIAFGRDQENTTGGSSTPTTKGSDLWAKGGGPKAEGAKKGGAGGGAKGGGKAAPKGKTAGKATVASVVANPKAIAANKWDQAALKARVDPKTEDVTWSLNQGFGAKVAASGMHQATLTAGGQGGVVVVKATSADKSSSATGKVAQVKFGAIKFNPKELSNDGKKTATASAKVIPGGRKTSWKLIGPAYGSKISAAGVITPGTAELPDKKFQVELGVLGFDSEVKTANSKARIKLWDAKYLKAKKDYKTFIGSTYNYPNFTKGLNGKFDVVYNPGGKLVDINVKVKFKFHSDDAAKGKWTKKDETAYRTSFNQRIASQWSKRYTVSQIREPKAIWSKLGPATIQVNVVEVKANQHFLIDVHKRNSGANEGANVHNGTTTLFAEDENPHEAFNPSTAEGELKRVNAINPSPVYFGSWSTKLPSAYNGKLTSLGTYIKRIGEPKFNITVTGHSSIWGNAADNMKRSQQRADAVANKIKAVGLGPHKLTTAAMGEKGGGWLPRWRKAVIKFGIDPAWRNKQDTQTHEFGHMLGLGDEYRSDTRKKATHYDLVVKAFGKQYAQQTSTRTAPDASSLMDGGSDVRVQHYVTLWSALCETTLKKAAVPDPKLGYDDWKLNG